MERLSVKGLLLLGVALVALAPMAHGDRVEYEWSVALDPSEGEMQAIDVDADGNLYLARLDLLGGTNGGDPRSLFVRKYSPDGTLLWEKTIAEEESYISATNLWVGDDDNVYLDGHFFQETVFDPDGLAVPFTSVEQANSGDRFVLKMSPDGEVAWVVGLGGEGWEEFVVASTGQIFAWGHPWEVMRHSSLPDVFPEVASTIEGTRIWSWDSDGAVLWQKVIQEVTISSALKQRVHSGHVDDTGGIVLVGQTRYANDFDPGPDLNVVDCDHDWGGFALRLTANGEFRDVRVFVTHGTNGIYNFGTDGAGYGYGLAGQLVDNPTIYLGPFTWDTPVDTPPVLYGYIDGLIRFDPNGQLESTALLPTLYWPDDLGLRPYAPCLGPSSNPVTPDRSAAVSPAGDIYLSYGFDNEGAEHVLWPAISCLLTKLGRDLNPKWILPIPEFFSHVTATGNISPLAGPDGSLFVWGAIHGEFGTGVPTDFDLDPTEGVDIHSVEWPEYRYFVTKLTDVLEPDVVSIVRAGTNPTNAVSVAFTVTFDEPVTGVDTSDFVVTTTGAVSGAAVTSVTGSGDTYTVTVSTGTGEGTIRLDIADDDSIKSTTNEPLSGPGVDDYVGGEAYTMDFTGPTAQFSLPGSPYTVTNEATILVTFDEPVTGVNASSFVVTNGVVTSVTGSGTDWTVTIEITAPGDATIDLAANGATDTAGNGSGAGAGLSVTWLDFNGDPSVPVESDFYVWLLGGALCGLGFTAFLRRPGKHVLNS